VDRETHPAAETGTAGFIHEAAYGGIFLFPGCQAVPNQGDGAAGAVGHRRVDLKVILLFVVLPPGGGKAADDEEVGVNQGGGGASTVDEVIETEAGAGFRAEGMDFIHRVGLIECVDQFHCIRCGHGFLPLSVQSTAIV